MNYIGFPKIDGSALTIKYRAPGLGEAFSSPTTPTVAASWETVSIGRDKNNILVFIDKHGGGDVMMTLPRVLDTIRGLSEDDKVMILITEALQESLDRGEITLDEITAYENIMPTPFVNKLSGP